MGKKATIPDHISESLETIFWVENTDLGSGIFLSMDPGRKFGSGINIPDPQHCSVGNLKVDGNEKLGGSKRRQ